MLFLNQGHENLSLQSEFEMIASNTVESLLLFMLRKTSEALKPTAKLKFIKNKIVKGGDLI